MLNVYKYQDQSRSSYPLKRKRVFSGSGGHLVASRFLMVLDWN